MISKLYKILFEKSKRAHVQTLLNLNLSSDAEKQDFQEKKLKLVLESAKNIPYYNKILKDIDLNNFTLDDLQTLPLLTKDIIRKEGDSLYNNKIKNTYFTTSGGSTGSPVKLYKSRDRVPFILASSDYAEQLNGTKPFDSIAILWGAMRDMHNPGKESLRVKLRNLLLNLKFYNTFILNENIINDYIKQLNHQKPKHIRAYVHSIYAMAKHINKNNIKIDFKPIIRTTTGPLYEEMREEIKRAFNNAHVYNFYGSREIGPISTETLHQDGMMVLFDNVIVEIVDSEGNYVKSGEEGELLVTTLNDFAMPLIRYKIGDLGVKGDNNPNITYTLQKVTGRTLGVIVKSNGDKVDGQFFTSLFFGATGIKNFQLVQETLHECVLNIVKTDKFNQKELDNIIFQIKKELSNVHIDIHFKEEIKLNATGKMMYVYTKIIEN